MKRQMCKIRFGNISNTKLYNYYTNIENLEKGDVVIVQTGDKVAPAYFESYVKINDNKPTKWIIDKLDMKPYIKKNEIYNNYTCIYDELETEIENIGSNKIYELLAKENENIRALLYSLKPQNG